MDGGTFPYSPACANAAGQRITTVLSVMIRMELKFIALAPSAFSRKWLITLLYSFWFVVHAGVEVAFPAVPAMYPVGWSLWNDAKDNAANRPPGTRPNAAA